jgi:hypothetical protein
MKKLCLVLLAFAGFVFGSAAATNFAARVISYNPGTNFAPGFTNIEAVLGEPSRTNPFTDATDPFNPPYGKNQVLSIGAGGSLTVKFARPVYNAPRRPYALDFMIFGNAGFIITNDFDPVTFEWIGTPATAGALFGQNDGVTRVSVSADGKHFFALDSELAPTVDHLFPSDGSGRFDLPVDPALRQTGFAGKTLEGIRELYNGSGGRLGIQQSAGARTARGHRIRLPYIRFVRVEVLEGKAEIDAFSAIARNLRLHGADENPWRVSTPTSDAHCGNELARVG